VALADVAQVGETLVEELAHPLAHRVGQRVIFLEGQGAVHGGQADHQGHDSAHNQQYLEQVEEE